MKSDSEIKEDVTNELLWDPQITEPEAIGVAVQDGAVTLTGHVPTYAQRLAAARAAERVYGVKAVANDLKVKLSGAPRDDTDIARAIVHVLEWNVQVPEGRSTHGCRTAGSRSRARSSTSTSGTAVRAPGSPGVPGWRT